MEGDVDLNSTCVSYKGQDGRETAPMPHNPKLLVKSSQFIKTPKGTGGFLDVKVS